MDANREQGRTHATVLESRNDEQTAADRKQVLEQSNVKIWLAQ